MYKKSGVACFNPKWTGYCGVRHEPGEVKLDLTFGLVARDRRGLNWKILGHEGGSVYDMPPCYRVCQFWELALFGAALVVQLGRAREQVPRTRNRSNSATTRLQTTAQPDFSRFWVVCNSNKTKQKGGGGLAGWCQGQTSDKSTSNYMSKCQFLRSYQKFKKILKMFLQE